MALTLDELRKVAELAQLEFSDEELQTFGPQINAILEYVDRLQAVDTEGIEATSHAVPLEPPLRADETGESLPNARALENAPNPAAPFFSVPKVIG